MSSHHAHDHSLRSAGLYALVAGLTLAAIVLALVRGTTTFGLLEWGILTVSVVLLGIPHGAVDHLVAASVFDTEVSWRAQARFYGFYLAAMLAYGVAWIAFPALCLALFLLFAVYHFGQSDLEHLAAPPAWRYPLFVSRGLLLVGLPLVVHLDLVAPVLDEIAGVNPAAWPAFAEAAPTLGVVLAAQHVLLLAAATLALGERATFGRELLTSALLIALFYATHPLVGFAVYFGLWHSLGHILVLVRHFRAAHPADGGATSVARFYRHAALFTGISLAGLGVLYALTGALGWGDQVLALLFILISVLTLPHMVVVEAFYQRRDPVATTA